MTAKRVFCAVACAVFAAACKRHVEPPAPADRAPWRAAYRAGATDATGHVMGGTELRALVPFEGKLFAGVGYWKDTSADDAALPGAQVLVLDRASVAWWVELELGDVLTTGAQAHRRRYQAIGGLGTITLTTDEKAVTLANSASFLAAGPWSRAPGVDVFVRGREGPWTKTSFDDARGNVRAFTQHVDAVTKVSRAFAGSDSGIFSGALGQDRSAIVWGRSAEAFSPDETPAGDWRVMAFAEANGRLYATIGPAIYRREDGEAPRWQRVYAATFPATVDLKGNGGLRGITAIANPNGAGEVLLVAAGGPTARMLRVDPNAGFRETVDLDVVARLTKEWSTPVHGALLAYNDMLAVNDPASGEPLLLIGLEAAMAGGHAPFPLWFNFRAEATLLVRHANGSYAVRTIDDHGATPAVPRVAVRTLARSPFERDVVYAGGFDANDHPAHETAWMLVGPVATLLASP